MGEFFSPCELILSDRAHMSNLLLTDLTSSKVYLTFINWLYSNVAECIHQKTLKKKKLCRARLITMTAFESGGGSVFECL